MLAGANSSLAPGYAAPLAMWRRREPREPPDGEAASGSGRKPAASRFSRARFGAKRRDRVGEGAGAPVGSQHASEQDIRALEEGMLHAVLHEAGNGILEEEDEGSAEYDDDHRHDNRYSDDVGYRPARRSAPIVDGDEESAGDGYGEEEEGEADDELDAHLAWLGIPLDQVDFHWIAEEARDAPFPTEWSEHTTDQGDVYYANDETGETSWDHPTYTEFRAVYEEERERAARAAARRSQRCLLVRNLPADAPDANLEDEIAQCFGDELWAEDVVQFDLFVDGENQRCALVRLVDERARDDVLELHSITLPESGGKACALEPVDDADAIVRYEGLSRDSRCVYVGNLPLGIDGDGVLGIFSVCEADIVRLRIADLDEERGAEAAIEFAESIAARRCARAPRALEPRARAVRARRARMHAHAPPRAAVRSRSPPARRPTRLPRVPAGHCL